MDNINEQDGVWMSSAVEAFDYGLINEVAGERQTGLSAIPGYKETTRWTPKYSKDAIDKERKKKKNLVAKFFSNLSRLGMNIDEEVIDNMHAIPADKDLLGDKTQVMYGDMFSQLMSQWKVKDNKATSFYDKDLPAKRETLRALALQPELEDILDTMTNESIVYDSENVYFAEPYIEDKDIVDFEPAFRKKIHESVNTTFKRVYRMLNWRTRAWDDFKRFLIEGVLAWEIVYDNLNKPTKIIGMIPIDPATLTRKIKSNKVYWIQYKGVNGKERKLLDSQVVYIQFQETDCISRLSYLERLVRPFNIYRIIEQAQIVWTVTNAQYKMKFTIPIKGMGRTLGSQTLNSAMNRYREDIKFIADSGELTINGRAQMPFSKEYWMPENEAGTPDIETIENNGPDLMDNDYLKYFKNQLYKISKIPLNRFDEDSDAMWGGTDASSYARTEIDFGRYVTRLRNIFAQIMLKPIQLQLCLDLPEFQQRQDFLQCIQLQFKSYNLFEELMDLDVQQKRVEFIQTMKDSMVDMDSEGNEIKFFSSKFLVQRYLKFSNAELELNEKYKKEEIEELNLAGDTDNNPDVQMTQQESHNDEIQQLRNEIAELKTLILENINKPVDNDVK